MAEAESCLHQEERLHMDSIFDTHDRASAALAFLSETRQLPLGEAETFFTSSLAVDESFEDDDWTCSGIELPRLNTRLIARHSFRSTDGGMTSFAAVDIEVIEMPTKEATELGGLNNQGEVHGVRRRGGAAAAAGGGRSAAANCTHCGDVLDSDPYKCQGGCTITMYCSKSCGKKHWKGHRKICKKMKGVPHVVEAPKR